MLDNPTSTTGPTGRAKPRSTTRGGGDPVGRLTGSGALFPNVSLILCAGKLWFFIVE